jgi:hypothetical protein
MKPPETPFPRHWLYYLVLKLLVLAAALVVATVAYLHFWA